jgi:hypothetical protein
MSHHSRKVPVFRPKPPLSEDLGAWITAILGVIFTLAIMLWPWTTSEPVRIASNTTTVEKTNLEEPPPKPLPSAQ